jgi:sugar lactone lactonase YvrE
MIHRLRLTMVAALFGCALFAQTPPPPTISTIAGSSLGDNGPALNAILNPPAAIQWDGFQNILYIADAQGHRVRRVARDGTITTIAGTGFPGRAENGAVAAGAPLNRPTALALDSQFNLYVAESGNGRIIRIGRTDGRITIIAGNGQSGCPIEGRAATSFPLSNPRGIALDRNDILHFTDAGCHSAYRLDREGNVTRIIGTDAPGSRNSDPRGGARTQQMNTPSGIGVDSAGGVYVADTGNNTVRFIDNLGVTRELQLPATAPLVTPYGLFVDAGRNVWVAERDAHRVRFISATGASSLVAGNGQPGYSGDGNLATLASLNAPLGVAVDGQQNVLIADTNNLMIRRVRPGVSSFIDRFAGAIQVGAGVQGTQVALLEPRGVTVDRQGTVYFSDSSNHRVRSVSTDGRLANLAGTGDPGLSSDQGLGAQMRLNNPRGLTVDSVTGNLMIADSGNHRVWLLTREGQLRTVAGTGEAGNSGENAAPAQALLNTPGGVLWDGLGTVWIADTNNSILRRITNFGTVNARIANFAGTPTSGFNGDNTALNTALNGPQALARTDAGQIIFADTRNHRVRRVDPDGRVVTIAGTGTAGFSGENGPATQAQLSSPAGVAVGPDGTIYIADTGNHRVRRILANGNLVTVAGTGTAGFTGDGGSPTAAQLSSPSAVAVDANGNVFIADTANHRIRRVLVSAGGVLTPAKYLITSNPPGRTLLVDGESIVTPREFEWLPGSTHRFEAPSPQEFNGTRHLFQSWSAGGGSASISLVMPAGGATFTANFRTQHRLSLFAVPPEGGVVAATPASADSFYDAGTTVAVRYETNSGYTFLGLEGDLAGFATPQPVVMDRPRTVVGRYVEGGVPLSVSPTLLLFNHFRGAEIPPVQSLALQTASVNLTYTVTVPATAGWLRVTPPTGQTPGTLSVSVAPGDLAVGTYSGFVEINAPGAQNARQTVPVVLTIRPGADQSAVSAVPSQLDFPYTRGAAPPGPQRLSIVATTGEAIDFNATVVTPPASQPQWLRISAARGTTPAAITVSVDPSVLPENAGVYEGEILIAPRDRTPVRVPVTFRPGDRVPPRLTVDRQFLSQAAPRNGAVERAQIFVQNPSADAIRFAVTTQVGEGQPGWLTATPESGSVTVDQSSAIVVQTNPQGLDPGVYQGFVRLTAEEPAVDIRVPVVLAVAPTEALLRVSQSAQLVFNTPEGQEPLPLDFNVLAVGRGAVRWQSEIQPASANSWLTLDRASGEVTAGQAPQRVAVTARAGSLAPGEYHAQLRLFNENDNQMIGVVLRVLRRDQSLPAVVRPASLAFTGQQDGADPEPRTLTVLGRRAGGFSVSVLPDAENPLPGSGWLQLTPPSGQLDSRLQASLSMQVRTRGLLPGVYRATITINTPGNLPVLSQVVMVVSPKPASGANAEVSGCQWTRILPVFTSLQPEFRLAVGEGANQEIILVDDCGNLVDNAVAGGVFSNQDRSLDLQALGANGVFQATYIPRRDAGLVTASVVVSDGRSNAPPVTQSINGFVADRVQGPVLGANNALVNVDRSPAPVVAPGSLVVINGSGLQAVPGTPPVVTLGGIPLNVQGSTNNQVTVLVPPNLPLNRRLPLVVQAGDQNSAPENVSVARTWPIATGAAERPDGDLDVTLTGVADAVGRPGFAGVRVSVAGQACEIRSLEPAGEAGLYRAVVRGCTVPGARLVLSNGSTRTGGVTVREVR